MGVSEFLVEQSARNCSADTKKAVSSVIKCVSSELLRAEKLSAKIDSKGLRAEYSPSASRQE
jgi:hypothetical protein